MWKFYSLSVPWYGLWADEFLVADNRENDNGDRAIATLKEVPMHGCGKTATWYDRIKKAQKIIGAAIK